MIKNNKVMILSIVLGLFFVVGIILFFSFKSGNSYNYTDMNSLISLNTDEIEFSEIVVPTKEEFEELLKLSEKEQRAKVTLEYSDISYEALLDLHKEGILVEKGDSEKLQDLKRKITSSRAPKTFDGYVFQYPEMNSFFYSKIQPFSKKKESLKIDDEYLIDLPMSFNEKGFFYGLPSMDITEEGDHIITIRVLPTELMTIKEFDKNMDSLKPTIEKNVGMLLGESLNHRFVNEIFEENAKCLEGTKVIENCVTDKEKVDIENMGIILPVEFQMASYLNHESYAIPFKDGDKSTHIPLGKMLEIKYLIDNTLDSSSEIFDRDNYEYNLITINGVTHKIVKNNKKVDVNKTWLD